MIRRVSQAPKRLPQCELAGHIEREPIKPIYDVDNGTNAFVFRSVCLIHELVDHQGRIMLNDWLLLDELPITECWHNEQTHPST